MIGNVHLRAPVAARRPTVGRSIQSTDVIGPRQRLATLANERLILLAAASSVRTLAASTAEGRFRRRATTFAGAGGSVVSHRPRLAAARVRAAAVPCGISTLLGCT